MFQSSRWRQRKSEMRTRSKIRTERKNLARGSYARCVREIAAAYIANLPTAVSNNWLPRQVHIPPIMCITAPCTAIQNGRGIVDDTLPLLLQIYLSPSHLKDPSMSTWSMLSLDIFRVLIPFSPFENRYMRYILLGLLIVNKLWFKKSIPTRLNNNHLSIVYLSL